MKKRLVVLTMVAVAFVAGHVQAQNLTCTGTVFDDVDANNYFCGWIEWFYDLGVTTGCSLEPPLYCPTDYVTRAQMAAFIGRAMRGGHDNSVTNDNDTVGGGRLNTASGGDSTIGGGHNNTAGGEDSIVGGGSNNAATGSRSTVSGGSSNTASGYASTVAGGRRNDASGDYSFAAGVGAVARHQGSFVWADSFDQDNDFTSSLDNQFRIRANGGATFVVDSVASEWVRFRVNDGNLIETSTGGHLTLAGAWTNGSDRSRKENIVPAQGREVLEKLARVPVSTWNYKAEGAAVRHMGPMAQDLYEAFGLGKSDTHISTVDADGVALAAIQGLYHVVKDRDERIAQQDKRIRQLEAALAELLTRVAALEMPAKRIAQK